MRVGSVQRIIPTWIMHSKKDHRKLELYRIRFTVKEYIMLGALHYGFCKSIVLTVCLCYIIGDGAREVVPRRPEEGQGS